MKGGESESRRDNRQARGARDYGIGRTERVWIRKKKQVNIYDGVIGSAGMPRERNLARICSTKRALLSTRRVESNAVVFQCRSCVCGEGGGVGLMGLLKKGGLGGGPVSG